MNTIFATGDKDALKIGVTERRYTIRPMIYATAFDPKTKKIHDKQRSTYSGMKSFDEVETVMGTDKIIKKTKRMIIYDGVVFSDFPFKLMGKKP